MVAICHGCSKGNVFDIPIMHAVGVSLRFRGEIIPNGSFVDLDDIMYTDPDDANSRDPPSNSNPRDEALLCVTDLVDCCGSPRTERGNWYYPNGTRVGFTDYGYGPTFLTNRGPNEVIDGRTVYGSVRLYRKYGNPPGRGRFRCELPNAADSSVNQIIYVNICKINFIYFTTIIMFCNDCSFNYPNIVLL